ncbi:Protein of unknown function [Bacillus cereus]|nr:Protein of unknown function [Bacillus cereus]SCV19826.1 Protein of unknown function [Bacillus cereus]
MIEDVSNWLETNIDHVA